MNSAICSLIILGICVVLFFTEWLPNHIVVLIGCFAMLITDACNVEDIFYGFQTDTIKLLVGMQIVGIAVFSSGIAEIIGQFLVSFSGNQERHFISIICLVSAALSTILSNSAVIAMMMTVCSSARSISKSFKEKNLIIPMAIAAIYGGHCTIMGSTTQLTASSILESITGETFSVFCLAKITIPAMIITFFYMLLPGYKIGKKCWENLSEQEVICQTLETKKEGLKNQTTISWKVMLILSGMIILFVLNYISPGKVALATSFLMLITRCVSLKEIFMKVDWKCVLWLGGCLSIGNAITISGGGNLVGKFLASVFGKIENPFVLLALIVFIVMGMSQLLSNAAVLLIIQPGVLMMVQKMGFQTFPFAYAMCLGAALTYLTPIANGHIGMTVSVGYRFRDYVVYGLCPTILTYLVIVFLTPVFYPLS